MGEVIGRWGADTNAEGREGFMVQFPDGEIVAVAVEEAENV